MNPQAEEVSEWTQVLHMKVMKGRWKMLYHTEIRTRNNDIINIDKQNTDTNRYMLKEEKWIIRALIKSKMKSTAELLEPSMRFLF